MIVTVLGLTGLFVFATAGALMAVHKGFDVAGIVVLASLTALGGGILRDLVIGATPPAAFTDVGYPLSPVTRRRISPAGRRRITIAPPGARGPAVVRRPPASSRRSG